MIIDRIENFYLYEGLNPLFPEVSKYLSSVDLQSHSLGKDILIPDKLYANFEKCEGKLPPKAVVETHNQKIDIQIPLGCSETMGFISRSQLSDATYNEECDVTFYPDAPLLYFTVPSGYFVIFFPSDGHAPCISDDTIHKVVFKVQAMP